MAESRSYSLKRPHPSSSEFLEEAKESLIAWRKRKRLILLTSLACLFIPAALAILVAIITALGYPLDPEEKTTGLGYIFAFLVWAGIIGILIGVVMRPLKGNPAHQIWYSEDPSVTGTLVEATQMLMPDVTRLAMDRLAILLPRLKSSDSGLLNEYQRTCLNRMLADAARPLQGSYKPPGLVIGILKAWEQIGDESALGSVRQLAEGRGMAARDTELRAAAADCLGAIRIRIDREKEPQILLRASSDSGSPALLRPASHTRRIDDSLLRCAPSSESGTVTIEISPPVVLKNEAAHG